MKLSQKKYVPSSFLPSNALDHEGVLPDSISLSTISYANKSEALAASASYSIDRVNTPYVSKFSCASSFTLILLLPAILRVLSKASIIA